MRMLRRPGGLPSIDAETAASVLDDDFRLLKGSALAGLAANPTTLVLGSVTGMLVDEAVTNVGKDLDRRLQ